MSLYKFKSIDSSGEINVSFKIRKKVFCEEQSISEKIEFDNLDHPAKPRWPLDEDAAFLKGAGVRL